MQLTDLIRRHEGVRLRVYCDRCGVTVERLGAIWACECHVTGATVGCLTIGVGHNLTANGLREQYVEALLADDVLAVTTELSQLDWWAKLDLVRRAAVVDMAFNLGVPKLKTFANFIAYLERGSYELAADDLLSTLWATEVPTRAADDAYMIRTGEFPR